MGVSLLAGVATGCSSDVLRFQDGFYTGSDQMTTSSVQPRQGVLPPMNGSGQATQQTMASQNQSGGNPMAQPFPASVPNYDQNPNYNGTYTGSIGSRAVESSALPPPSQSQSPATSPAATSASATAAAKPQAGWSSSNGGSRVALRPGETIYTLSRRDGVPADALMKANGISDATSVAAGQEIVIPSYNYGKNVPVSAPDSDPRTRNASALPQPAPAPSAPAEPAQKVAMLPRANDPKTGYGGTKALSLPGGKVASVPAGNSYTVQKGDTLTRIAIKNGVSVDALKEANAISGSAIRIGQTLKLPSGGGTSGMAAAPSEAKVAAAPKIETPKVTSEPQPQQAGATEPKPASYTPPSESKSSVAEAQSGTELASLTPESTGIEKLRWPVRGQVVAKFGSEQDGNRNDGIDISVPEGTPIKAAENGVVIYAGDGLKEYGNTVLIRHENGLVTVYGYAKDLKVSRGDKVSRGQVIADSGMSGAAQRPKLHFEVRKDASPVDPMGFLD
jgi:murein DD-endopeptidase MepM/ murein hydrolase activator NlpD